MKGFSEGIEIRCIPTETSNPKIAELLADMMDSPVLVVLEVAEAPKSMLAEEKQRSSSRVW
ncbi:hypothetical protein [Candidatus Manganitrophus noduliformans]|uniref:Uncharacterized protein n=1 Tax=Candidatus Manganitrophus noduliformans TaxID=2606439 RepID=A0A7X6DN23_9BACT|nr:hypothetical protein [Candidatus Manganitrophus noduliformans]NKE70242.1 hypothetical protein [Candidatus Manganitrophus noduliformans]